MGGWEGFTSHDFDGGEVAGEEVEDGEGEDDAWRGGWVGEWVGGWVGGKEGGLECAVRGEERR